MAQPTIQRQKKRLLQWAIVVGVGRLLPGLRQPRWVVLSTANHIDTDLRGQCDVVRRQRVSYNQ